MKNNFILNLFLVFKDNVYMCPVLIYQHHDFINELSLLSKEVVKYASFD